MTEKLPTPTGTVTDIKVVRVTPTTAMRYTQPAVNQPYQKTVPGKDSAGNQS
jgi:hypothetical protein